MCLSLCLKGCMRISGKDTEQLWLKTESTGNPSRPGAALWWEAGFTISDSVTQAGVCFFYLSRWFYIVLSCSGWTWVRNFEVWGLSDTFCCALKQISGNSIVFLQEVSVSFLTQLIMCDYKHACIKYHQKKKNSNTIRTQIRNTKITRVDFQEFYLFFS